MDMSDPRNMRMEEMSRRQRRMESTSAGGQRPAGAVVRSRFLTLIYIAVHVIE
jgi:hypothetical protein